MKQTVIFRYLDYEIEAKVEWEGSDFSVDFFNPQTGYTSSSNPSSIMNGWSYQDPKDNFEMQNLIEAIATFYYQNGNEWVEHLTWEDGATDTFIFTWDNESYLPEVCYIDHDGEPVHYKRLDLVEDKPNVLYTTPT
jgi:hypothetical protein